MYVNKLILWKNCKKILLDLLLIDTLPPSGGIYMNETRFSKNCAKNGFLILGKCVEPDFI